MKQFTHLHLHSHFSLLDGLIDPMALCKRIKELGMDSVAVTDHGNMYGLINFYQAAKKVGIKPILGLEAYISPEECTNHSVISSVSGDPIPKYYHVLLLVKNEVGYQNLMQLATLSYLNGFYYKPRIDKDMLQKYHEGLICTSACFPVGTSVFAEGGLQPIEKVVDGRLMTHDGNLQAVIAPTTRIFTGNFVYIKTKGGAFDVVATEDHEFYTIKKCNSKNQNFCNGSYDKVYYDKLIGLLGQDVTQGRKRRYKLLLQEQEPVWKRSDKLKKLDMLLCPIDTEVINIDSVDIAFGKKQSHLKDHYPSRITFDRLKVTPKFLEILGLFCAEGHCFKYGISFCFNIKEKLLVEKVKRFFLEVFDIVVNVYERPKNNKVEVIVGSMEVSTLFNSWTGTGSKNIHMPLFVKHLKPSLQIYFLKGCWLGDGSYEEVVDKRNLAWQGKRATYACISKQLIADLVHIFYRHWINPLVNTVKAGYKKDGIFRQETYYLRLNGKMAKKLFDFVYKDLLFDVPMALRREQDIPFKSHGIYYMKQEVKSVVFERKEKEQVYCLNVANNHSFIAEGVVVHNCLAGEPQKMLMANRISEARDVLLEYKAIFGDDFYFEIMRHGMDEQEIVIERGIPLARELGIPIVATNDCHYLNKEDVDAHNIILNIQNKTGNKLRSYGSGEFYVKSADEMYKLFPEYEDACENTVKIAEQCNYDFTFGNLHFPKIDLPDTFTEATYLEKLSWEGFIKRYPNEEKDGDIGKRLQYELNVINNMGFPSYFIIVTDFMVHAKDVLDMEVGCARGSAGGSVVAYCLRITEIDPMKYDLMFERFLNPERVSMPDIDIDFPETRRHEVIEYVVEKYGSECVSQISTVNYIKARTAIRDVARVMMMPISKADVLAKSIPSIMTLQESMTERIEDEGKIKELKDTAIKAANLDDETKAVVAMALRIEGTPRHVGVHAAGVVIGDRDLSEYVPLAKEKKGVATQYTMDILEPLGLLKMDFLGLRTLDVIRNSVDLIRKRKGISIDTNNLPMDDETTCQMLCRGEVKGVFQTDSKGMQQLIKDIAPKSMFDCVPAVALYRPGPLESGMVEKYIACRHGIEEAKPFYPTLEPITKETYHQLIYQEQVMLVSQVLSGFSIGEADMLRKAIGKKLADKLAELRTKFVEGAIKTNPNDPNVGELADALYTKIEFFGRYCFNKAHSAAYALIMYQTAFLKANHPVEYMCCLLTTVMGKEKQFVAYLREAKRMKIKVLSPSVNHSGSCFTVDNDINLRYGLSGIKGLSAGVALILEARENGEFLSFFDFLERVRLHNGALKALTHAGAFDCFGFSRQTLLKKIEGKIVDKVIKILKDKDIGQLSMFEDEGDDVLYGKMINLPEIPEKELLALEKGVLGLYLSKHPIDKFIPTIKNIKELYNIARVFDIEDDGKSIVVAGVINSCKVINTRKGDQMAFLEIEDRHGSVEVVVFPAVYANYQNSLSEDRIVLIEAYTQIQETEDADGGVGSKDVKLMALGAFNLEKMHRQKKIYVPSKEFLKRKRQRFGGYSKSKKVETFGQQQERKKIEPKKINIPVGVRIFVVPDKAVLLAKYIEQFKKPGTMMVELCIGKTGTGGVILTLPTKMDLTALEPIFKMDGLSCDLIYNKETR